MAVIYIRFAAILGLMLTINIVTACSSTPDDGRLDALKTLGDLQFTVSDRLEAIWAQRMVEALETPMSDSVSPPATECDRVAADPRDPGRVAPGVRTRHLDGRLAVRACGRALDSHPNEPRFKYQLARAFEQTGQSTRGLSLLQEAARDGYRMAQEALGEIYLTRGQRLSLNLDPAIRWLERAAAAGAPVAQYQLGRLLFAGTGVERDVERARDLFADSARIGYPRAQRTVAGLNMTGGDGIKQNVQLGFNWFKKAAEGGDPSAQYFLSKFYKAGIGTRTDDDEALRWLRRAATAGHPAAQALLGAEHLGFGDLDKDDGRAYFWLSLANRAGVLEVTDLVSYAADQLDAATLRRIDRASSRWQPYDPVPELLEVAQPIPDDRPKPDDGTSVPAEPDQTEPQAE